MNNYTKEVRRDVTALAKDARALVVDTGHMAGERVGAARQHLSVALDSAQELCGRLQQKTLDTVKATDQVFHDHPYQAVGIALAVGAFIGFLLTCGKKVAETSQEHEKIIAA